jgi:hypothetical protein
MAPELRTSAASKGLAGARCARRQIMRASNLMPLILLCVGCVSYTPRNAPIAKAGALPVWKLEGPLAVGADAYLDADTQTGAFDAVLTEVGILPVQILIQNRSDMPIVINPSRIALILPNRSPVAPVEARAVVAKFALHYGRGFDVGAGAFGLIGLLAGRSAVLATEKAQADRHLDYAAKELRKVTIEKEGSTQGFVFFSLPGDEASLSGATLTVPGFAADETTVVVVHLPLPKLDLPAQAARKK